MPMTMQTTMQTTMSTTVKTLARRVARLPLALALAVTLFAALPASDARAIDLDQAKAQGLVGERFDGLIAPVSPNPSPDIQDLVRRINEARLAKYRQAAQQAGTTIELFRKIMGKKVIEQAPSGTHYMTPDGTWHTK